MRSFAHRGLSTAPAIMIATVMAVVVGAAPREARAQAAATEQPPVATPASPALPKPPKPTCTFVPVDLALWNRISINGLYPGCARNVFGLALGLGRAGELRGVQLGILGQAAERKARGIQVAGVLVAAGDDAIGLQLAGLVAAAGESMKGIQLAGLVAASGEHLTGLQLAGLVAASGERMRGMQVAGLGAASGESATGVQLATLLAASGEGMRGVQIAGLFAASGERMRGLQVGGLLAASGVRMRGLQIAGVLAGAGSLDGIQIAGVMSGAGGGRGLQIAGAYNRAQAEFTGVQLALVNMGHVVRGAQIGVVNIAHEVHGAQIGIVNVAQHADAPLGLVSWMQRGQRRIEVWGSEAVPLAAAARFGTKTVYSLVGLGGDPFRERSSWGPLGGVGVEVPLGILALSGDVLTQARFSDGVDDRALLAQARARVAMPVAPCLALTAGLTWNVFVSDDVDGAELPLTEALERVDRDGDTTVRQWPGFTLGASLTY